MRIDIQSSQMQLDPTQRALVVRLAGSMLAHMADKVRHVVVRLRDISGPRGDRDQRCQVTVRLDGGAVTVESRDRDFSDLIERSLEQARHAVSKRLRQSEPQRRVSHRLRADPLGAF